MNITSSLTTKSRKKLPEGAQCYPGKKETGQSDVARGQVKEFSNRHALEALLALLLLVQMLHLAFIVPSVKSCGHVFTDRRYPSAIDYQKGLD